MKRSILTGAGERQCCKKRNSHHIAILTITENNACGNTFRYVYWLMEIFYRILWTIAGFFFLALFPIAVCVGVYLGICWIKERK